MKRLTPPLLTVALSVLLALFSAALTYTAPSQAQIMIPDTRFFMQTTPTPQEEDRSEIGSTDEIVIMGGVIAFIIILPIVLRRKSWR